MSANNTCDEYLIRCKTCNSQIAYIANFLKHERDDLLKNKSLNLTKEQATEEILNNLKIFNWCCRIALNNPTKVFINLQNTPNYYSDNKNENSLKPGMLQMTNQKTIKSTEPVKEVSLDKSLDKSFVIPKSRGINTINPINDLKERNLLVATNIKNLNADDLQKRKVPILNGRTYLAR
jgi:DNA-directed RNA polymerase subunit N (RpoN/RPB10)